MIRTNNQPRHLLSLSDFSEADQLKIRTEFDWLGEDLNFNDNFFKYRGIIYHLAEFTRCDSLNGWDGLHSDSWSSGTVVKLSSDLESVIVGRWSA